MENKNNQDIQEKQLLKYPGKNRLAVQLKSISNSKEEDINFIEDVFNAISKHSKVFTIRKTINVLEVHNLSEKKIISIINGLPYKNFNYSVINLNGKDIIKPTNYTKKGHIIEKIKIVKKASDTNITKD